MRWLGLRTRYDGQFRPAGIGRPTPDVAPDPDQLLVRGSVLLEAETLPVDRPINLLRYSVLDPWPSALSILQEPDGTFRLLLRQGARNLSATLRTDLGQRPETVHITYSWDAPARRGTLSVHASDRGALWQTDVPTPFPLTLRDARRVLTDDQARRIEDTVEFIALSDAIVPAGPLPGISPKAEVATPDGPRAIRRLKAGDLVSTIEGSPARILWAGHLSLPAIGRFTPTLIRKPYHGLTDDLVIAADQRVCLTGTEIEYLFGEERVSSAIRHMADRNSVHPVKLRAPVQTYCQVLLDRHTAMQVNGAWVESLDAKALFDNPALKRGSVLKDLPPELHPVQAGPSLPILQGFEALTLTETRYG